MAGREPYDVSDGITDREGSTMLGCPACAGVLAQRRDHGDDRLGSEIPVDAGSRDEGRSYRPDGDAGGAALAHAGVGSGNQRLGLKGRG